MTVTLSTEIEKIIHEKISSGAYQSAAEVVSVGVRLLEAKEKGTEALRLEIMRGFEDIQEGRYTVLSSDEELETFSDNIIWRAKERRDASKSNPRTIKFSIAAEEDLMGVWDYVASAASD